MGGKEAKERRRLKRLEMQQEAKVESKTVTVPQNKAPPKKVLTSELSPKTSGTKRKIEKTFKSKEGSRNHRTGGNEKMKAHENKTGKESTPPKKFKKPKHLSRKLKETTDPKEALLLQKMKSELDKVKSKRAAKFERKVIGLVGGEEFFDKSEFDRIMANGGAQLDSILDAVKKRDDSDVGRTKHNTPEVKEYHSSEIHEDNTEEKPNDETRLSSKRKSVEERLKNENISPTTAKDLKSNSSDSGESGDDSDEDSDDSDEDSDDSENYTIPTGRQRGRKRKGREETDAKRDELNEQQQKETSNKKVPKSEDKRRCIGRKPITDFCVGKKYSGKVVYIKPLMGIFLDINAHSDAFCHISRVSDEYIESINDDFCKIGDILEEKIRVIDIDRSKKRITVSLQSDSRIADEKRSEDAWKDRKHQKEKQKTKPFRGEIFASSRIGDSPTEKQQRKDIFTTSEHKIEQSLPQIEEQPIVIDEANMTPAELKRARKLQRRAERRKQQELTGISS